MNEIYSAVASRTSAQYKIEGSRFIADVIPVVNEEEATAGIEAVQKKYFDATHHCFAYVVGAERNNFRYSDDGEPSGTAGIKIYTALQAKHLSDTLIVVTRYFGGTKLGVGGLGRAYFDAAENGIAHAVIIAKAFVQEFHISFPFAQTNPVMNIVNTNQLKIKSTAYTDEQTILVLSVLPSSAALLQELFKNATRGTSHITLGTTTTMVWKND